MFCHIKMHYVLFQVPISSYKTRHSFLIFSSYLIIFIYTFKFIYICFVIYSLLSNYLLLRYTEISLSTHLSSLPLR